MFFIPGFIIALVTFPGVIVHELAHQFFCRIMRVAVLDVCYFRLGNPAGYVRHELPKTPAQHILIGIGPFIVNTTLGALIALPASIPVLEFASGSPLDYFLMWVGVSIAMHSFPSVGDAEGIWEALKDKRTSIPLKVIGTPIVGIIYLCAAGSVVWLDLAYGIGVAMLMPYVIVHALA